MGSRSSYRAAKSCLWSRHRVSDTSRSTGSGLGLWPSARCCAARLPLTNCELGSGGDWLHRIQAHLGGAAILDRMFSSVTASEHAAALIEEVREDPAACSEAVTEENM